MGRWPVVLGALVLSVCPTGAGVSLRGVGTASAQTPVAPDVVFQSDVLERTVGAPNVHQVTSRRATPREATASSWRTEWMARDVCRAAASS
jgi:hypothetical protein